MRILLYGMQSSGASLVTFFIGQMPRTVTVVDLWNMLLMPRIDAVDAENVVGKAVVSSLFDFEDHARSFEPDKTVLVLRHPVHNYVALSRKYYADESGGIDDKFRQIEASFRERNRFDLTLLYEDFVERPEATIRALRDAGVPAEEDYYAFPRTQEEMKEFNFKQSAWCREHFESGWAFGNVQGRALKRNAVYKHVPRDVRRHVRALCPTLCDYFDAHYAAHTSWYVRYKNSLWHDALAPAARSALERTGPLGNFALRYLRGAAAADRA